MRIIIVTATSRRVDQKNVKCDTKSSLSFIMVLDVSTAFKKDLL